jgi:hypothetical protein
VSHGIAKEGVTWEKDWDRLFARLKLAMHPIQPNIYF